MRNLLLATGLAICGAFAGLPATAQGMKDRAHVDSFGNLVVVSASGYKRILVGQGTTGGKDYLSGSDHSFAAPRVIVDSGERSAAARCWRPPHVWHGRSYMYGLPDGAVPQAPLTCTQAPR